MSAQEFKKRVENVQQFLKDQGRMPSYSEMCELFLVKSKQAVARVVDKMIEHGLVEKDDTGQLIPKGIKGGARMLGTVQAGFPSPAEEELADVISMDDFLIANQTATFLLKVSGDSMIDAGIQEGDLVLVERGKQPKKGDIVVAEVDHEWTMKYFENRNGKTVLIPANKNYPIIEPEQELVLAGVVTAVVRKYH